MNTYRENLKMHLLTETINKMDDVDDIITATRNCWSGVSCENFLDTFTDTRAAIAEDLRKEYADLESRINDLQNMYYKQDMDMTERE